MPEDHDGTSDDDASGTTGGRGSPGRGDADHDGAPDGLDNCPDLANPRQEDADTNGIGDACQLAPPPATAAQVAAHSLEKTVCSPLLEASDATADLLTNGSVVISVRVDSECVLPEIQLKREGGDSFHASMGAPGEYVYTYYDEDAPWDAGPYRYLVRVIDVESGLPVEAWTNEVQLRSPVESDADQPVHDAWPEPANASGVVLGLAGTAFVATALLLGILLGLLLVRRNLDRD